MTISLYRDNRPLRQVLRQTGDPELMDAFLAAAADLDSELGADIRSELARRPSKDNLRYFIPLFASWPSDIQQQAIKGSTGTLKAVLISLLDGPLSAGQWSQIADSLRESQLRLLMNRSHIDDDTLLRLARREARYASLCNAGKIAHDILMATYHHSPARLLYAAAYTSTARVANIARDVFSDEDLARHITPENVAGAWVVAYSKAATDERVIRWLNWLRQTEPYDDIRRRARYSHPRSMSEFRESTSLTAYSLSAVASARGLSSRDLSSLISFFDIPFDRQQCDDPESDTATWKAMMSLRTLVRASSEDLGLLAEPLSWETEVLSRSGSPREVIMRNWIRRNSDGDAITLCAGELLTLTDASDREVAVALGYALSYLSRQAMGSGHSWASVRSDAPKLRPGAIELLRELAEDGPACQQLHMDQTAIRRRLKQFSVQPKVYVDDEDEDELVWVIPHDDSLPPIELRTNRDLRRLLGIQRWLSLNGRYGRPTNSLRYLFSLTAPLSSAGLETFLVLLESWQGTFDELVAASQSLSAIENL